MPFHPTRRQMIALTGAAIWAGGAIRAGAQAGARAEGPALPGATEAVEGRAFASHWRITAPAGAGIERQRAAIDALLAEVDRQMSPWRSDSEITRFNTGPGDSPASPETCLVAHAALGTARASGGWFDPTVGPLVARWGFGPIRGGSAGDWQGLSIAEGRLLKDAPGLTMDLCGIAKGRALDLMAAHLQAAGIADFLVDLGGELKSAGRHPAGRDWRVAVEDPRPDQPGAAMALRLPGGMAVATSGLRAQSYTAGGHRYGHIIAPPLARPAEGRVASVSVLSPAAMTADGWATALLAAEEAGPDLARSQGLAALFLMRGRSGLAAETTGDFAQYLL